MLICDIIFTLQAKWGKKCQFSHVVTAHSSHQFLLQPQEPSSSEQLQVQ